MHTPNDHISILLVEDNSADARLVRAMLYDAPPGAFSLSHVDRLTSAIEHLATGTTTVVLLDLSLPDGHGLETVSRIHAAAPSVPIVVMSGNDDEELGLQGVRQGAQDYLIKGRVDSDLLIRSLRYAIERKSTEDRLAAKTREQEAFIYTVAHDLRAPLVSLQGMAGILASDYGDTLDESAKLYIERISANAQKMQNLLNDLLQLSRIDRVDTETSAVNLDTVVRGIVEQLGHSLHERGARVEIDETLPTVTANETRMGQVFTNLIDNAVTYTPADRQPVVHLRALRKNDEWEIVVQDNGVGIPDEFRERVLGIFQRLPAGKRLNPTGSGIGLAIVTRVIEGHGGKLWIESREGEGTAFHFTLPSAQPIAVGSAP